MHARSILAVAALAVSSLAAASHAALIPVNNASFEAPDAIGNGALLTVTGWGQGADTGVTNDFTNGGPGTPPVASDGQQIAFLGNGTNFTNLFQDVANAGQAGATAYTLTVAFAIRAGFGETPGTNSATSPINLGIQDLTGTGATVTTPVLRSTLTNTFQDFTVTLPALTVAPGDAIRLFIDKTAGNSLIVIDNVRLNAVPEPTTLTAAAAAMGLLARRRRIA